MHLVRGYSINKLRNGKYAIQRALSGIFSALLNEPSGYTSLNEPSKKYE